MSKTIRLVLDGLPPSSNRRYVRTRAGRNALSAETAAWQDGAILALRAEAVCAGWQASGRCRLRVWIVLTDPHPARSDLDNHLKCLLDSVKVALGIDDRYVTDLRIGKVRGPQAQTEILICALGEENAA